MKKSLFIYMFAAVLAGGVITSCSNNDDPDVVVCPVEKTTFTDLSGLTLTYSGQPMLGKQVEFAPDATDGTKAVITLSGAPLNLSRDENASVPTTAGVIPGEKTTVINVDLVINNDEVSFEGVDEKDGRKISYKGNVSKGGMTLDLTVEMPQNAFAGTTWNLVSTEKNPILIKWEADEFPFGNGTWDIQNALNLIIGMTQIEDKTIPQMLCGILGEVSFLPDGNIQAKYKNSLADADWTTSPLNIASYTVTSDNELVLYINPAQIIAMNGGEEGSSSTIVAIFGMIPSLQSMLTDGIPLGVSKDENGVMSVYLEEEVLLPILQSVKPLLSNEDTINMIMEMIKASAGSMAGLAEAFLRPILVAFPNIIDTTEDMEIGIKLEQVAE